MDISKLSKEQREALRRELAEQERAEKAEVERERETYKQLVDKTVEASVKKLQLLSAEMMRVKQEVFMEFGAVVKMKNELFRTKGDRKSDTFTTTDANLRITLGSRINEGWDDTVESGIEIVKEYLATLAKDDNSAALVDTVMSLLAKNNKGALKANKVLELKKLASKAGDARFLEGISIIENAYRPVPSCQFIQVEIKGEKEGYETLPLSLSAM